MIDKYFKIAADVASLKKDSRIFRVGCAGIRADGVIVAASNGPAIIGDNEGIKRRSFPAAHAEARCVKKLDKNAVVFVVRVRRDNGQYAMARPCHNCMGVLLAKNIVKIYYTIDYNTYGIIYVKNKRIFSEKINHFRKIQTNKSS